MYQSDFEESVSPQLMRKLDAIVLPKWPKMCVWGEDVTQEQAENIILRTDRYFTDVSPLNHGNNHQWEEETWKKLGLWTIFREKVKTWDERNVLGAKLREEVGFVKLNYVHNTWASSSFFAGPYGFCSPSGKIHYRDNVGKHPEAWELYDEWRDIAKAFPYLNLTVTLMSGEQCEENIFPVVSFIVADGSITLAKKPIPLPRDLDMGPRPASDYRSRREQDPLCEQGIQDEIISRYALQLKEVIAKIISK